MYADAFSSMFPMIFCSIMLINVVGLIVMVIALVDCVKNEKNDNNNLLIWVLIIVLAGWIGALIYYFVRVPQRNREISERDMKTWNRSPWR